MNKFKHIRTGILHLEGGLGTYERCIKHGKEWEEGDLYEENGGKACKKCILKSNRDRRLK